MTLWQSIEMLQYHWTSVSNLPMKQDSKNAVTLYWSSVRTKYYCSGRATNLENVGLKLVDRVFNIYLSLYNLFLTSIFFI